MHEHTDLANRDHKHSEYITTVDSDLADEKIQRDIDEHKSTNHRFLELSGGHMDNGADIIWPPNTGTIIGLNKAVDDTSPVRKKEFDEAISGGDSGLKDQVEDNTARLDKEIDDRKKGDASLEDSKSDKTHKHDDAYQPKGDYADANHTHEADTAEHEHPEYELKSDADDKFTQFNEDLNQEIKDRKAGDADLDSKKSDKDHTHDYSEMVDAAKEALGDLDDKIDAVDEKVDQEIQDRTDGDAAQAARNDEQDARLDDLEQKTFNGEYKYKKGNNKDNVGVVEITKMDDKRLYTRMNIVDLNGQQIDMKFFVENDPISWIIDGVRWDFESGSYNLSGTYLTANVYTAAGGLADFVAPANGAEVIVNTPAEPFDIAKYATIEYSDGKDDGLALRIDSLEQLTTGNQADLGGASWTCDDEVRESHFTTRKDDPSSGEWVSDIRMFRQWLVISKFPASGGDTDQWPIGDSHPSTLTVRSYDGWTATYSCGEQKNFSQQWEIDCYFLSTDAPEGTQWSPGSRYEIKMQAQDTTLDETYASIGHDHGDSETAAQVEQNKKDIQLLKSAMADKMEVIQIELGNWTYAGENKPAPRAGNFSTDDWYFSKVTQIYIDKKAMKREVRGAWTGVEIGDEVTITYDDEPWQPWDERYNGRYLITSIVDKSGDLLIAEVDFVDGFGTIRDDRKYQIKIRGARIPDHSARIGSLEETVADLLAQFENRVTVALWRYRGSNNFKPENLGAGEFSIFIEGAAGAEAGTMIVYLSRYDPSGNYWMHNSQRSFDYDVEWLTFGMHKPGMPGQYTGFIQKAEWSYYHEHDDTGTYIHKITCNYRFYRRELEPGDLYVLTMPGYLPTFLPATKIRYPNAGYDAEGYEIEDDE